MSNAYYDNGAGGGGFVGNGSPYGQSGSQGSPSGGKGKGGNATCRAVTIKQLMEAAQPHPDADFSIDGVDVNIVMVVAVVRNEAKTPTNVSYAIEDGTGSIDAKLWLDSADDGSGKNKDIEQDTYVSVMGTMKSFGGKRHLSATHIRPITDHNEVFYHLLQALHISLSYRNPSTTNYGGASKANNAGAGNAAAASDYTAGGHAGGGNQQEWAEYPPLLRQIMTIASESTEDAGMHVAAIARAIGGDGAAIMESIEHLITEGMLFTTVDDMHVKVI